jgi:hypothetical protein
MVFGFNLDGVLRNTIERVYNFYMNEHPSSTLKVEDINIEDVGASLGLSKEEYSEFLEEYLLEIFGSAKDQYRNSNKDFNNLVYYLNEKGHEVVIIQEETGKIKSATLYFISDRCLDVSAVYFVKDNTIWDKCDVLVTANPKYLRNAKKTVIKVNRPYNMLIPAETNINEIKDMFNLDLTNI